MIVIAIIGILASIVLVSLNSARTKAKDAAATASVGSLAKAVQMCLLSNTNLGIGSGATPTAGQPICGGSETYPALSSPWSITNVYWEVSTGYYWIRAVDGGSKIFLCYYAAVGSGWTTDGIPADGTYKCTKIGF